MTEQSYEQIRRRMLNIARMHQPHHADGFVPASIFTQAKDDEGRPEKLSDEQTQSQIEWLMSNGLLDRRVNPHLGGDRPSFRHQAYRLSDKGWKLWMREIPPIPGVADDRLEV